MTKSRASIFADPEEESPNIDLESFAPKSAIDTKAPPAAQVRAVAEAARFRSREGGATPSAPAAKREPRRYRTGRNVQFNVKALKDTVDAFYTVSEAQDWVLGYTLQRAMEALQRELAIPGKAANPATKK